MSLNSKPPFPIEASPSPNSAMALRIALSSRHPQPAYKRRSGSPTPARTQHCMRVPFRTKARGRHRLLPPLDAQEGREGGSND